MKKIYYIINIYFQNKKTLNLSKNEKNTKILNLLLYKLYIKILFYFRRHIYIIQLLHRDYEYVKLKYFWMKIIYTYLLPLSIENNTIH